MYLKRKIMQISREKKLEHFYSLYQGGKVLDVGVNPQENFPSTNFFLKTFRYSSHLYTGLGIEDLSTLVHRYPDKKFVQYSGKYFPFEDGEFDYIFSNAVIEHVGNDEDQLQFINEMLRVGKNLFFTTPNKFFPLESHTNIFFLHWHNKLFYKYCRIFNPSWNYNNLYLFSYKRLDQLLKKSDVKEYKIYRNLIFGLTITFTVVCQS